MTLYEFDHILIDRKPDGVLLASLNRPDFSNAITDEMKEEIERLFHDFSNDKYTKVLVLTGEGDSFSTGGDINTVNEMISDQQSVIRTMQSNARLVYGILGLEKPFISAINGDVAGGGTPLCLLADISVIADEARVSARHVRLGVVSGNHATMSWPLLCGMAKAKYYLLTGDAIDGKSAADMGLVSLSVPKADVLTRALAIASQLAQGSQTAIRGTKAALNNWYRMAGPIFDHSVALETVSFLGPDAREAVNATIEGRAPVFPSARLPD